MGKYILKRILMIIPIILGVAVLIFTVMYFTPGNPAQVMLGTSASQAQIEALEAQLGLDQPYIVQLFRFLKELFLEWDVGVSYMNQTSVMGEIIKRLPRTLILSSVCVLTQLVVAIPLGVSAAFHQNKWQDALCTLVSVVGSSVPGFWLALMMIMLFSNKLHWLPSYGIGSFWHWIMPCVAVCVAGLGAIARQTRSQMLEVIRSDYIVTARAKGMPEKKIKYRHALPNALIPVITGIGNSFGISLGGTVVIETAFSIPGVGLYMVQAIGNRDLPVIRGGVVVIAILFSVVILVVDLIYAFIDPRVKAQYERS